VSTSFGEDAQPKGAFDPSAPLTERERNQILRLFSEPMEFPLQFRSWVKNYIETVGITLPRSAIVGLKQSTTLAAREVLDERLPPGSVFLFAGEEPPPGTERFQPEMSARGESFPAPPGLMYVIVTAVPD
jgi:hypothetical protein